MRKFTPMTMLVYGNHGVGKTVFLGTAVECEELSPTLLVSNESGLLSINSKIRKFDKISDLNKPEPGKIDVIRVTKWNMFDKILDLLYDTKNPTPYKSVLIDSLSEINYLCLDDVVNTISVSRYAAGVPVLTDYGAGAVYMRKLARGFRNCAEDLGISVFMTASAQTIKDESTGQTDILPNLAGKLAYEVEGLVDIVGYMYINKNKEREIQFQPDKKVHAKDRTDKLGEFISKPTLNKIIEMIKEDN